MKISYAISVCDEFVEIQKLLPYLLKHIKTTDEIVVLFDSNNGSKLIEEYLRAKSINGEFQWHSYKFDGHFARMKNKLTALCSGDYIVNIDADEMVNNYLIEALPQVLEQNNVDVIFVPRINTVAGLTPEHVSKWGWNVSKLNSQKGQKVFDLTNPQDLDEYNLLKTYNLIIEESVEI